MSDKEIKEKYNNCDHLHNKRSYMLKHIYTIDEIEYIKNRFKDSSCLNESLDRILYNIEIRPCCQYCGKAVEYIGKKYLFRKYCSNQCKNKNANLVERNKIGCLKKYGVDNISKLEEIKEHKKQTHLKNYGTLNNFGLQKVKQTIYNKYGVDNISKLEEIKERKKQTTMIHYNVEIFLQHPIARERRKSKESLNKEYNTKRKNHSFKRSSLEDESYNLLKEKYPDIIRQYYSEKYPFACDFYIPTLDLYIECNYHWTHGKMPFNENNRECINKLNNWKNKNTKYYNNAIYTWTNLDVRKYNIANENKLNYKIFWNFNELKLWMNKKEEY